MPPTKFERPPLSLPMPKKRKIIPYAIRVSAYASVRLFIFLASARGLGRCCNIARQRNSKKRCCKSGDKASAFGLYGGAMKKGGVKVALSEHCKPGTLTAGVRSVARV